MSIVRMSRLGKMGRFGNMVLQSMFLRAYAARHGAKCELAPSVLDRLFIMDDVYPISDVPLDAYQERGGVYEHATPPKGDELVNRDFVGYAQIHTSWYTTFERVDIKTSGYPHAPRIGERFITEGCGMAQSGRYTFVGIHLRRGDYGQLMYYITPVEWYLKVLEELWPTLKRPVLFVATEDPSLLEHFKAYNPKTSADLGLNMSAERHELYPYLEHDLKNPTVEALDFYPDFFVLSRLCRYLLIPNSTYSYAAAMLNGSPNVYRSSLEVRGFEKIDPWNDHPIQFQYVEDYPDVPGIALDTSPYWHRQPGGRALRRPRG